LHQKEPRTAKLRGVQKHKVVRWMIFVWKKLRLGNIISSLQITTLTNDFVLLFFISYCICKRFFLSFYKLHSFGRCSWLKRPKINLLQEIKSEQSWCMEVLLQQNIQWTLYNSAQIQLNSKQIQKRQSFTAVTAAHKAANHFS
jgi:hypothetical protein